MTKTTTNNDDNNNSRKWKMKCLTCVYDYLHLHLVLFTRAGCGLQTPFRSLEGATAPEILTHGSSHQRPWAAGDGLATNEGNLTNDRSDLSRANGEFFTRCCAVVEESSQDCQWFCFVSSTENFDVRALVIHCLLFQTSGRLCSLLNMRHKLL